MITSCEIAFMDEVNGVQMANICNTNNALTDNVMVSG